MFIIGMIIGAVLATFTLGLFMAAGKQEPNLDSDRLNWLIDQGPPMLDDEFTIGGHGWDMAAQCSGLAVGDVSDQKAMRAAIDFAMCN